MGVDQQLQLRLPHLDVVEELLTVPLLPYPGYEVSERQGVPDIRITAHDIVMSAVAQIRLTGEVGALTPTETS
jgi:hypothetical protein